MTRNSLFCQAIVGLMTVVMTPQLRGDIRILAVTSSANYTPGLPGPGSLATVFCSGLSGIDGVIQAQSTPLPRSLGGVRVSVGTADAPLLAVANFGGYQQINFQVPWEAETALPVTVAQGSSDHAAVFGIANGGWSAFFTDPTGNVLAQHASDYRPVTVADPARRGEWIIAYASNLGPVEHRPATGEPASPEVLSPVALASEFKLVIGLSPADTQYIGLTPGSVGVYQVNFRVPDKTLSGVLEIAVERTRFCGFFFDRNCGRGFVTTRTLSATLPYRSF